MSEVQQYCASCGAGLKPLARFCANCGASVVAKSESVQPPVTPVVVPAVVTATPVTPRVASPPQYSIDGRWWWDGTQWVSVVGSAPSLTPQAKKSWGVGRILVLVFVVVPLLIVAAITVYLFWSSQNPLPCGCVFPPTPSSQSSQVSSGYGLGLLRDPLPPDAFAVALLPLSQD